MQLEIADVLEPLYRAGEEWEKLHQIHEVQLGRLTDVGRARRRCCAGSPRSPSRSWSIRSRRSAGGRRRSRRIRRREQALDELLRLARATHQWDAYVTTMPRRASRRATAGGPARRAAAAGRQLRERPRRPRARRGGAACRCWRAREGSGGAGVARSDLREPGDVRATWPAILRQRIVHHRRQRGAGRAEPPPRAGLRRGARRDRPRDRQLPGGAGARVALARGARGPRAALLPQRALAGAVRRLREAGRHRQDDERHGRLLRAHGEARRRRARRSRARRSSCGAASSTSAARTPIALVGPGRSARDGRASGRS